MTLTHPAPVVAPSRTCALDDARRGARAELAAVGRRLSRVEAKVPGIVGGDDSQALRASALEDAFFLSVFAGEVEEATSADVVEDLHGHLAEWRPENLLDAARLLARAERLGAGVGSLGATPDAELAHARLAYAVRTLRRVSALDEAADLRDVERLLDLVRDRLVR